MLQYGDRYYISIKHAEIPLKPLFLCVFICLKMMINTVRAIVPGYGECGDCVSLEQPKI